MLQAKWKCNLHSIISGLNLMVFLVLFHHVHYHIDYLYITMLIKLTWGLLSANVGLASPQSNSNITN